MEYRTINDFLHVKRIHRENIISLKYSRLTQKSLIIYYLLFLW